MSISRFSNSQRLNEFVQRNEKVDELTKFTARHIKSEPLSVLIISTQMFCEKLKHYMSKLVDEKYEGNITIKLAEDVNQVLDSGLEGTSIDYVALVCDTTTMKVNDKIFPNISRLKGFLVSRLCLVNGSPKTGLPGSARELVKVAEQFNLLYINGQIMDNEGCKRVSERILALAATSCGLHTGIPVIVPTPVEVFKQVSVQEMFNK